MKFWVGVTDNTWFSNLAAGEFDEVNFWHPKGTAPFKAPSRSGAPLPFLFKLKSPHHAIAGGGYFAGYTSLPIWLAWDVFGPKNGTASLDALSQLLGRHHKAIDLNREIGCTVISNPFFLPRDQWLHDPPGFATNIVTGKFYDDSDEAGGHIWKHMRWHFHGSPALDLPAARRGEIGQSADIERWGQPTLVRPRLGQGAFRALVTNAYQRRCAITGENTLVALEAAHILPYSDDTSSHEVKNGMLLRADFHKLFDKGLVGVTPELTIKVSPRIREAWYNGKAYYRLDNQPLQVLPANPAERPDRDLLAWHMKNRFQD